MRHDKDVVRRLLQARDGRLLTIREMALTLRWPEGEVRSALASGRAEGWVRTVGRSPTGAALYGFTGPAPGSSRG